MISARARLSFVLLLTVLLAPFAFAQTTAESSAKVTQLLKTSGYDYHQKTDTVWYIDFQGKSLKSFRVILAVKDNILVTFVTPATKAQMPDTPQFLRTALGFNHTFDFVKIGIDDDGDLFVRYDSSVRVLDPTEFKAVVEQVAAATDEVYGGIGSYLK